MSTKVTNTADLDIRLIDRERLQGTFNEDLHAKNLAELPDDAEEAEELEAPFLAPASGSVNKNFEENFKVNFIMNMLISSALLRLWLRLSKPTLTPPRTGSSWAPRSMKKNECYGNDFIVLQTLFI